MDLEIIMLSEVKERLISYDITYVWNIKNNTNGCTYKTNRFTDRENKLVDTKGEREVETDKLWVCD